MEATETQSLSQSSATSEQKLRTAEAQAAQQAEAIYEQQQAEQKSSKKVNEEDVMKQAQEIYEQEMKKMQKGESSKDAAKDILGAIKAPNAEKADPAVPKEKKKESEGEIPFDDSHF